MRIISGVVSGVSRLAGLQVELSRKVRQRLKWFDYYNSYGHNARLTYRYFSISPQTFCRWERPTILATWKPWKITRIPVLREKQ